MNTIKTNGTDEATHSSSDSMMTVYDVASLLNISHRTVDRLCQRGQLPAPIKMGRIVRWRRVDVMTALENAEKKGLPCLAK